MHVLLLTQNHTQRSELAFDGASTYLGNLCVPGKFTRSINGAFGGRLINVPHAYNLVVGRTQQLARIVGVPRQAIAAALTYYRLPIPKHRYGNASRSA